MTSRPSTGPTTHARKRRPLGGSTRARAMTTRPSSGSSHERAGRQTTKLVRSDEGDPHHEQGEDREQYGETCAHPPARPGVASGDCAGNLPVRDLRLSPGRGAAVDPQPHDVVAERRVQQGECGEQDGLGQRERQDVGSRDGQHDPLNRGDDPAPVAPRQRCTHPRQHPAGGVERVARRPDREHPHARRAGDVHAEDCDQERVHLTVEVHCPEASPSRCVARSTRRPRPA